MRRDLCYFYPVPVEPVFDAFVQAAKQKFGKNAILKGTNLQEAATAKDRNNQIGGHRA